MKKTAINNLRPLNIYNVATRLLIFFYPLPLDRLHRHPHENLKGEISIYADMIQEAVAQFFFCITEFWKKKLKMSKSFIRLVI